MKGTHSLSCCIPPCAAAATLQHWARQHPTTSRHSFAWQWHPRYPGAEASRVANAGSSWARGPPHTTDSLCTSSQQPLLPQVPELAGFLLLSFLIQLPLLLFLLTDSHIIHLPLEMAVHSLFLAFLVAEIVAAFLALKTMTKQLAAQFYLQQFKEGCRGQPGQRGTMGQAAEEG